MYLYIFTWHIYISSIYIWQLAHLLGSLSRAETMYTFWIFLDVLRPVLARFLVGEQPGHLGIHFYMKKLSIIFFIDNRE